MEATATPPRSEVRARGSNRTATGAVRRWLSPALFALACLAFFLPFATVSCDGARTSFTGAELVTSTVPHGGVEKGNGYYISQDVEGTPMSEVAAAALAAAVLGLVLGLLGHQKGPGWLAAAGLVATVFLGWFYGGWFEVVTFHSGYWLLFLLFTWAAALHARRARRRWSAARADRREGVTAGPTRAEA